MEGGTQVRTDPHILCRTLFILGEEIESGDGVANAAIIEAAHLLDEFLKVARYWCDVSECECNSPLPQGGCLRCDLHKLLLPNEKHS